MKKRRNALHVIVCLAISALGINICKKPIVWTIEVGSVRLVKCPLCEEDFKTLKNVCEHISKEHNVSLIKETAAFNSLHGIYINFVISY